MAIKRSSESRLHSIAAVPAALGESAAISEALECFLGRENRPRIGDIKPVVLSSPMLVQAFENVRLHRDVGRNQGDSLSQRNPQRRAARKPAAASVWSRDDLMQYSWSLVNFGKQNLLDSAISGSVTRTPPQREDVLTLSPLPNTASHGDFFQG